MRTGAFQFWWCPSTMKLRVSKLELSPEMHEAPNQSDEEIQIRFVSCLCLSWRLINRIMIMFHAVIDFYIVTLGDTHHGIEPFRLVVLHDAVWLAVATFFFCLVPRAAGLKKHLQQHGSNAMAPKSISIVQATLLFSYHNWKQFMSSKTSDVGSWSFILSVLQLDQHGIEVPVDDGQKTKSCRINWKVLLRCFVQISDLFPRWTPRPLQGWFIGLKIRLQLLGFWKIYRL